MYYFSFSIFLLAARIDRGKRVAQITRNDDAYVYKYIMYVYMCVYMYMSLCVICVKMDT